MNFWTSDRCKTISTELLLSNLGEFLKAAQVTKNSITRTRNLEIATLINAELSTRN